MTEKKTLTTTGTVCSIYCGTGSKQDYTKTTTMAVTVTPPNSSSDQYADSPCTISLPIVYGSIAHWLGKQANEHHTHKWSLYLHPAASPTDMTLDSVIEKVSFHLHPSFPRPVRELSQAPYQVTEMGWGEFEASIKIYWLNSSKSVTSIVHQLQLYETTAATTPTDPAAAPTNAQQQQPIPKKPVINENYDEVVFTFKNPNEDPFYQKLIALTSSSSGNVTKAAAAAAANKKIKVESDGTTAAANLASTTTESGEQSAQNNKLPWPETQWTDEDHVKVLAAAQNYVNGELNAVKDRILKADIELQELVKAQRDLDAAKVAAAAAKAKSKSSSAAASSR